MDQALVPQELSAPHGESDGDLLHIMHKKPEKHFNLDDSRFYTAEVLSALQHIHSLSYVHRDVKPENILVAATGHIMISDFGSVKDLSGAGEFSKLEKSACFQPEKYNDSGSEKRLRRSSFVGTAQYVSPEVLEGQPVSPATDLWALGVVIYQFLTANELFAGRHAFHDESEYLIYKRIQKLLFSYPPEFPDTAKDLIDRLLVIKVSARLFVYGNGPMAKVIRSRWVYRPHGRWHRYLPRRNDGVKEYDYSKGGSLAEFKDEFMRESHDEPKEGPSKLWMAWLYRDLSDYRSNQIGTSSLRRADDSYFFVQLHPDGTCEVAKDVTPVKEDQLRLLDPKKQVSFYPDLLVSAQITLTLVSVALERAQQTAGC
ncbi:unnamed protein product [Nippostrongylus brasiliensis]|uniref:Protein kinase domain-containing protein n=1 Tax=Nippostrongylus brasiliensis TaxID=27835 RepID=A0A0N4YFN7_NIPBR|nr:unnamed protein product [Nippostrongylus brasiliensis]